MLFWETFYMSLLRGLLSYNPLGHIGAPRSFVKVGTLVLCAGAQFRIQPVVLCCMSDK